MSLSVAFNCQQHYQEADNWSYLLDLGGLTSTHLKVSVGGGCSSVYFYLHADSCGHCS